MLSLTPFSTANGRSPVSANDGDPAVARRRLSAELELYLSRAEQESIAVVRATDERAAASHCRLGALHSAKAVALLIALEGEDDSTESQIEWEPRLVAAC